jgi:hypothetical protein
MANDIVRGRLWCVGYKAGREGIRSGVSKEFFFFSFFFFFFFPLKGVLDYYLFIYYHFSKLGLCRFLVGDVGPVNIPRGRSGVHCRSINASPSSILGVALVVGLGLMRLKRFLKVSNTWLHIKVPTWDALPEGEAGPTDFLILLVQGS